MDKIALQIGWMLVFGLFFAAISKNCHVQLWSQWSIYLSICRCMWGTMNATVLRHHPAWHHHPRNIPGPASCTVRMGKHDFLFCLGMWADSDLPASLFTSGAEFTKCDPRTSYRGMWPDIRLFLFWFLFRSWIEPQSAWIYRRSLTSSSDLPLVANFMTTNALQCDAVLNCDVVKMKQAWLGISGVC